MHCLFINLFHLWQLHPNINWVMAFGVALNGTLVQCTSTHNNIRCCKIAAIQPDSTLHWEIVGKRERESESYQTDRERSPKHMQHMNKIAFSKGVTKLSLNHKNTFRCLLVVRFSRVFCHSIVCVCECVFMSAFQHYYNTKNERGIVKYATIDIENTTAGSGTNHVPAMCIVFAHR